MKYIIYLLLLLSTAVYADNASILATADKINKQVNNLVKYTLDKDLYGVDDYWATPAETLAKKRGDCEDYAILKRALLLKEGIKSRLGYGVILHKNGKSEKHMIDIIVIDGVEYALDNFNPDILKLSERKDLSIVVQFDTENVYRDGKPVKIDVKSLFPQVDVLKK